MTTLGFKSKQEIATFMNKNKAEPVRAIAAYDTDKSNKFMSNHNVLQVKPPSLKVIAKDKNNYIEESSDNNDATPLPGGHGKRKN